jgi:hypothetical protein
MFVKLRLIEFSILILWTLVMIALSIVSVVKGHDIPMGLAAAYGSCMTSFAIKQFCNPPNDEIKR